jgi:HK97 family phage major capsid protein
MPSAKLARLQDESVAVTAEIETLRSYEPSDETDAARVEARMKELSEKADRVAIEAKAERELDARLEALRSIRTSDSDAKAPARKAPAIHVRGPAPKNFESADEARVAGEYLRAIARGEKRAWGETSPTYDEAGSELTAPAELYGSVINVLARQSVGARVALVVNTVAKRITLPKVSDATAAFYTEAAEGSLTDIDTAGVDVDVFGIRSLLAVSNDLIEDSPLDLASVIAGAMGNGFATRIDTAWLQGDETADITGLVGTVTNSVPVAAAGDTTAAELAAMVGQVDPLAMNTAWVVSPAGFGALLAAHAGTGSVMLSDAMQPTVFGRPVYTTNALPSGTLALYGDFSMATAVAVKASGLRIDALRELRAVNDQVLFVGKQRIGIANHAPQFVSKLVID